MNLERLREILSDTETHKEAIEIAQKITAKAFKEAEETIAQMNADVAKRLEELKNEEARKSLWQKVKDIFK